MDPKTKYYHEKAAARAAEPRVMPPDDPEPLERERYFQTLGRIANFQPGDKDDFAQAWAEVFVAAAPQLQEHMADFAIDERLEELDTSGADPLQCLALQLFARAAASDREGIVEQLQAAHESGYLPALKDCLSIAAFFLDSVTDPPWTPAYRSKQQLAADLVDLPAWSVGNIKHKREHKSLEQRAAAGGKRYRAADPDEQRAILQQIRIARSGHIAKQESTADGM